MIPVSYLALNPNPSTRTILALFDCVLNYESINTITCYFKIYEWNHKEMSSLTFQDVKLFFNFTKEH